MLLKDSSHAAYTIIEEMVNEAVTLFDKDIT